MYIYGLLDPRNNTLRYVGQTVQSLESRLKHHVKPCEIKKINYKCQWLKGVIRSGFKPKIILIQECLSVHELNEAEVFYIEYFKYIGANLVNSTPGGMGAPIGNKNSLDHRHSEESKRKIGQSSVGRKNNLGKSWSNDHKRKIALNNPRRKVIKDNLGNVYESIAEASRKLGIPSFGIRRILNGKGRSYKGKTFTFINP